MINLKINNKSVEVEEGELVLDAAGKLGIDIPTMCYYKGFDHFTSCMVCMVKDASSGKLIPSCSVKAVEGMEIITDDDEVIESRKTALDLLLSEHVGDCEAPCTVACPAHMDIPHMNRLLAKGDFQEAVKVVKKDIALPSVLGRVCPAPCESICHRKSIDSPVSICMLKRFAGDSEVSYIPPIKKETGKKVAIIGGGPAGLAAAYHIRERGNSCTLFEKDGKAGGILWSFVEKGELPGPVLEREIEVLTNMGIVFNLETEIDDNKLNELIKGYDAVIIAWGEKDGVFSGLEYTPKGIKADKQSYQTNTDKVFAVGRSINPTKMVIRILAQGKEVAFSIEQFLNGNKPVGETSVFNSKFGKLFPEEFPEYLKESEKYDTIIPEKSVSGGFSPNEVKKEAARCLHCDCRDKSNCKLRIYSHEYKADQKRFKYDTRKAIKKQLQHKIVAYEPGKCIKCGTCIRITEHNKEQFGFTYIGRGFDMEIGVPFNEDINIALTKTAKKVAEACPTGAISKYKSG
jgi:NADPH-dependent glutamate synthase beta subunit-like oxidoreductase